MKYKLSPEVSFNFQFFKKDKLYSTLLEFDSIKRNKDLVKLNKYRTTLLTSIDSDYIEYLKDTTLLKIHAWYDQDNFHSYINTTPQYRKYYMINLLRNEFNDSVFIDDKLQYTYFVDQMARYNALHYKPKLCWLHHINFLMSFNMFCTLTKKSYKALHHDEYIVKDSLTSYYMLEYGNIIDKPDLQLIYNDITKTKPDNIYDIFFIDMLYSAIQDDNVIVFCKFK